MTEDKPAAPSVTLEHIITSIDEPTWLVRLREERNQLSDRLSKLSLFMAGDGFIALSECRQGLLRKQHDAMWQYLDILSQRLLQEFRND